MYSSCQFHSPGNISGQFAHKVSCIESQSEWCMEFIKIRASVSPSVCLCPFAIVVCSLCVRVCLSVCVCVFNPHLPAIVVAIVAAAAAAGQVQPLAKMSACYSHTRTNTGTRTLSVTANWFAHSHTDAHQGVHAVRCAWGGDFSAAAVVVALVVVVVVAFLLALI